VSDAGVADGLDPFDYVINLMPMNIHTMSTAAIFLLVLM
jgi:hypothetical protein